MPGTIPAARQHLIDAIASAKRASARGTPLPLGPFVQAYYRGVDEADLRAGDPAALAAAAAGHLRFGAVRKPGRALVRVFNPDRRADGWQSPRTVVEVVTDDMPFLVDSLAMVLNGCGLSIHAMVHPVLAVRRDRAGRLLRPPDDAAGGTRRVLAAHRGRPHRRPGAARARARSASRRRSTTCALAVRTGRRCRSARASIADDLRDGNCRGVGRAGGARGRRLPRLAGRQPLHVPRLPRVPAGARRDAWTSSCRSRARASACCARARAGRGRNTDAAHGRGAPQGARGMALLVVTKANSVSTVHRATYLDYVGVKTFDARGEVTGERRFIGLFTSAHLQREPARHPAAAPQGAARHRPLRHLAREPRRQGADARARDAPARRAVPGQRGGAGAQLPRHRQPLRAPPRAPAAAPRPVRAVLLLPAVRAARPLQHPGPRAHRGDPARGTRAATRSRRRCRSRSPRWRGCTCWCAPTPTARSTPTSSASSARITETVRTWEDRLRTELHARLPAERPSELARASRARSRPPTRRTCRAAQAMPDMLELLRLPDSPAGAGPRAARRQATDRRAAAPAPVPARRADRHVRPAAAARELRPARAQRAAVPRRDARRRGALDPGPRGRPRRRRSRSTPAGRGTLRGGVLRRLARPGRERRLQPPGARRRPRLAPGAGAARGLPLPAADRPALQPALHGVGAGCAIPASPRGSRGCSRRASTRASAAATRTLAAARARARDRRGARAGHEPGRRPHPARVPRGRRRPRCAPTTSSATRRAQPKAYLSFKLDPQAAAGAAEAAADVRDLGVLAARRGRAPAHGQGGARRPALVRPARGLPHRDPRPDEGAERQEHADRAGGRQGRLRAQAAAARATATRVQREGTECYRIFIRGLLDLTDNVVDGKVVPPRRRRAPRPGRPLPRGGGRQGHGHRSPTPPTRSPPSTASGSATPSPPAARRATTTRRWASPPRAPGSA